jgi:hypothetical protein
LNLIFLVIFIGLLALVIRGAGAVGRAEDQRRRRAIREFAGVKRYEFQPELCFRQLTDLGIPAFDRHWLHAALAPNRRLRKVLHRSPGEDELWIFDCEYVGSSGDGIGCTSGSATLCLIASRRLALTPFWLRPRVVQPRFAGVVSAGVSLAPYGDFEELYRLDADDSLRVCEAFGDPQLRRRLVATSMETVGSGPRTQLMCRRAPESAEGLLV